MELRFLVIEISEKFQTFSAKSKYKMLGTAFLPWVYRMQLASPVFADFNMLRRSIVVIQREKIVAVVAIQRHQGITPAKTNGLVFLVG